MTDVAWALQKAIYSRLSAQLSVSVFDDVPEGQDYPYVVIGDEASGQADSLGVNRSRRVETISVFSNYEGKKEVKEILQDIYGALHRYRPALSEGKLIDLQVTGTRVTLDADGRTYMGTATVRALTEP